MGLFGFVKDAGVSIFKGKPDAREIEDHLRKEFGSRVISLRAGLDGSIVKLVGICDTVDTREQVILVAGNLKGIEKVNDDGLRIKREGESLIGHGQPLQPPASPASPAAPTAPATDSPSADTAGAPEQLQSVFYTIKSGDTLSKIAKEHLGNATKYTEIFEANRDVIKDVNKIYPGQVIRIPLKK